MPSMFAYRLDLEYEGTRYSGWQAQANARTVSGELRRALVAAGAQVVELGGAGRTDAGVHAAGQTAHLRLAARIDPGAIRRAVNELLAPDIHLLALRPASPRFHARHQAVLRSYVYQVSRRRTAMAKRFVWWIKRPIRVEAIRDAARELVGRRDFSRLCEAPSRQASTVVVVDRVEVAEDGDLILFRFVASHFLWKMVRRTVGALVRVGTGELTGAQWRRLVDPRSDPAAEGSPAAAWTAPPSGLFLERVAYPGE
ncbi:MAG TPA: tRNA pseudouridine(38-40) synthase TruA, partial [Candidatus Polarisedimenticolaceae bacterium]|nr:tRNA pseudouridine(38-40) synthase TruA [Candidatus Polarisedimenticolaceae bacterium]